MARFRSGQRESKAPMMRPGNIRRSAPTVAVNEVDTPTPDSEDAIEEELLEGTNDGYSTPNPNAAVGYASSEPDSRAEDDRSALNATMVATRSTTGNATNANDTVVKKESATKTINKGQVQDPSVSASAKEKVVAAAQDNGTNPGPNDGEAMETESGELPSATRSDKVSKTDGKDPNDSKDSGNGFDDDDDIAGLYACISMVEEQTKANFPKTARPPGLVDCSLVSTKNNFLDMGTASG